ncbi:MAG: ATP/GTP-binding protein [Gammaproteobacteria bacterium]
MLIVFSVSNFRSIRDTQTLSLVAGTGKELRDENTFDPGAKSAPRLLRSAAVFGPNAAGKSNLAEAMNFMRTFVQESAMGRQQDQPIPVTPFRLESACETRPAEFEMIFVADGVRYQYGFALDRKRVFEEWLLAYPAAKAQRWFERTYNTETGEYDWYFGPSFKRPVKVLQQATRANALFLSTAIQLNNEQLRPVFNWYTQRLVVIRAHQELPGAFRGFTVHQCQDPEGREKILKFLKVADLGIDGLHVEKHTFTEDDLPSDMEPETRERVTKEFLGKELMHLSFLHTQDDTGEDVAFDFDEESDGTQKLFSLAGPWIDVLERGMVLVMDELDIRLHPLLTRFLIGLLHGDETNPSNAQLVFTTHDTTLMEGDLLRRDQMWFVEKDKFRATRLFPLSDFRPRKHEAIQRGYLRGRYGALPYVRRLVS